MTKGYVRPYQATSLWTFALIPLGLLSLLFIYVFFAIGKIEPDFAIAWLAFCMLCIVFLLFMLIFEKSAARYCIDTDAVYSRDLVRKHCFLYDDQVKQIELCMSVGDVTKYNLNAKAPHLICSDRFYAHDNRISLSYHRKSQVVVRITRKNFPAVQEYLCRMGIISGAVDYDMLVEVLGYEHDVYRKSQSGWQKHVD